MNKKRKPKMKDSGNQKPGRKTPKKRLPAKERQNIVTIPKGITRYKSVECPANNYAPVRSRLVYKTFNVRCRYFRKDSSDDDLYAFCVSKRLFYLSERKETTVTDIGINCSNNCPFASYGPKKPVIWVHRSNHKRSLGQIYYSGEKFFRDGDKPENDKICLAKDGERWKMVYIYTAKLKGLVYVPYSKKRYEHLVKGK